MDLEYGLDQKVPLFKSILLGLQWAALLVSVIIILGNVIGALHFEMQAERIIYLQKLFFLSGAVIFSQVLWGHRLPLVSGPSAVLLIGVISGQDSGMSTIYTSVMLGGLFIFVLSVSGLFGYMERLFTPSVVAVVLMLITFTLAPTIRNLMADAKGNVEPLYNLFFSIALIFLMFLFYRLLSGIGRSTLLIWAMIAGSLFYHFVFPANLNPEQYSTLPWLSGFFQQMNLHLSVQPSVLVSFIFCSLALSINDLGSIQSVNELLKAEDGAGRVKRGISITGLANIASGFFGVIGPVDYSLSPGIIMATRCASRFTLLPASFILLIMAFFPAVAGFIGRVPSTVIGAILAYAMASQVAAGLLVAFKEAGDKGFQYESGLVIGLSTLLGTIVAFLPAQVVDTMPVFLRPIMANGFVTGVTSAFFLEHIVFRKK